MLANTTISSNFYDIEADRTVTLFLYSTQQVAGVHLDCYDGDVCSIICTTKEACEEPSLYLNCSNNNCQVTAAGEEIIVVDGNNSTDNESMWIYYILGSICGVLVIVTTLSLIHKKKKFVITSIGCKFGDGVNLVSLWIYGLQMWDFFSDIFFSYTVINLTIEQGETDLVIFALAILSPIFIVIPYFANLQASFQLYSKISINNIAQVYFDSNVWFFFCLVVLSGK